SEQSRTGPAVSDDKNRWHVDPALPRTLGPHGRAGAVSSVAARESEGCQALAVHLTQFVAAYPFVLFVRDIAKEFHRTIKPIADRVGFLLGKNFAVLANRTPYARAQPDFGIVRLGS